jgi:hypothetical protein
MTTCVSASVATSKVASSATVHQPILEVRARSRNVDLVLQERLSLKPLSPA